MTASTFWTRERRTALRTLDQHLADAERINRPATARRTAGQRIRTAASHLLLVLVAGYALGSVLALPVLAVVLLTR